MASAAYERRNAAARAEGYESYYHKRIMGGRPPDAPRPSGDDLEQARGHRGAADLERLAASGQVELISMTPSETNSAGQWTAINVRVQTSDGRTRDFTIRTKDFNRDYLGAIYAGVVGGGGHVADRYNIFGYYEADDYEPADYADAA